MALKRSRLRFYRSVRAALLATNKRTDNSIITVCNIAKPLVDDKGVVVSSSVKNKKTNFVRSKKPKGRFGKSNIFSK